MRKRGKRPLATQVAVQIESDADLYLSLASVTAIDERGEKKEPDELCIAMNRQTDKREMVVFLNKTQMEAFLSQLELFRTAIR